MLYFLDVEQHQRDQERIQRVVRALMCGPIGLRRPQEPRARRLASAFGIRALCIDG